MPSEYVGYVSLPMLQAHRRREPYGSRVGKELRPRTIENLDRRL